jgi:hypothetical protein
MRQELRDRIIAACDNGGNGLTGHGNWLIGILNREDTRLADDCNDCPHGGLQFCCEVCEIGGDK